jgi:hypothetical protein
MLNAGEMSRRTKETEKRRMKRSQGTMKVDEMDVEPKK